MDVITLHPAQLARLIEYGEVTVHLGAGRYVRLKVRQRADGDGSATLDA